MKDLDLHMTQLVGWLVQTVGRAIVFATVIPGVLAIVGAAVDAGGLVVIAGVAAPLIFGGMLWQAEAPFPVEVNPPEDRPA